MTHLPPLVRSSGGTLSTSAIGRHAAAGRLVAVVPGVYLRADVAGDPHWRAHAVAAWRPRSVLLRHLAAQLTFWPRLPVDTLEFACETTVRRPGLRSTRRHVDEAWVRCRGALRMTHPALTALDLSTDHGGDALDELLRSRRGTIAELRRALAENAHRRGNKDRRRLLLESRAEPWSAAERLAHAVLRQHRIGGWRANVGVLVRGQRYVIDIAFLHLRVAIEIDGREFHTAAHVFETDRARQNALVLAGWTVLRFTYAQLLHDPEGVAATVRRGLALARRRGT